MKHSTSLRFWFSGLFAALFAAFIVGCEHEDTDWSEDSSSNETTTETSESTNNSGIVGTWYLVSNEGSWYVHFKSNGKWNITDDKAAATGDRARGSYSTSGESFSGDMINPKINQGGEIHGTFSGSSMVFNFVEYWHTPHKTITYQGTKQ